MAENYKGSKRLLVESATPAASASLWGEADEERVVGAGRDERRTAERGGGAKAAGNDGTAGGIDYHCIGQVGTGAAVTVGPDEGAGTGVFGNEHIIAAGNA